MIINNVAWFWNKDGQIYNSFYSKKKPNYHSLEIYLER